MEEEKLLRRKKKAVNGSNRRVLAETCNDLATFYYKHNRYSDALDEYKYEAAIYKELSMKLEWGTANRMIGEMYMLLAEFEKALKHENRHFAIAKELNNLVEEQRALATLGRIYLLQGQSTGDSNNVEAANSLRAAEKAFMKSLVLCEKLNGKVIKHELMDMRARLLLNIGVVQEQLGCFDKALDCIKKSITICSNQDLYDVLHQCCMTEAQLHCNKFMDYAKTLNCLNIALDVASRLDDKALKQCESLAMKGDILSKMSDYQSAKQVFLKAWKLNTPDEEERVNIERNLKVVAAMCYTEDLLVSTDPNNHNTFKKLYEKLGDGACHFRNYSKAVEYYLKMLEHAELMGECGKSLIPIYVSLYQTYKDMGSYNEALLYYEKEYELIKDVPKEAYTTLYNIAEALYMAKKPYEQVEKACLDARNAARQWNRKKYEIRILKNLLKYQEQYEEYDKMEDIKIELKGLGCVNFDSLENSEDEQSSIGCSEDQDAVQIGDDVCLNDLTDLSDNNEEDILESKRASRKRGQGFSVKKNMKGETQLHVACICGNKLLVERLIAKGHPVNVRDNAGWLPLHEACIHGHLEVVNILINQGAHINDRGGSNCDGITPLYDAASNGHLEIVLFLLEKGAIPSLKTDFGETPFEVLQKWRAGTILNKEEETLYNNIYNKMNLNDKSIVNLNKSKSKSPVKRALLESPPSTSKNNEVITTVIKRRNIIDDIDSDDELTQSLQQLQSDDSNYSDDETMMKHNSNSGVSEYRNAISALRNRSINELPEVELKKSKPALLEPNEVDDDWLEDDMGLNRSKKRKLNDQLTVISKRPSYETIKETIDNINKINDSDTNKGNSRFIDVIDVNDSSDTDLYQTDENVSPKSKGQESFTNIIKELKTRDSRENIKKRWKRQSNLFKSGFQKRKVDIDYCSSNSDCESSVKFNNKSPVKFTRKPSNEVLIPANLLKPVQSMIPMSNGRTTPTIIPPAVKVHVEDKVFLISIKLNTIHRHTISWLVEEVKTRYYKLTGIRPVFSLMTCDGAILSEDDPLSLVLSSPELKTCITNWKASPAEERYLECCEALCIASSQEIQHAIGRSHVTHRLALGVRTLPSTQIRPLFRALTHQTHITAIMISNNNIGDDGLKYLIECMCTLKHITLLDVSRNNITENGIKALLNIFEKATKPSCVSLEHIDLSLNPIGNNGFKYAMELGHYIRIKGLKMRECHITENVFNSKPSFNLDSLEILDISHNEIKQTVLSNIITHLNSNLLVELEVENVGVDGSVVGFMAAFLDMAKDLKLRKLNLSGCKLVDGQFMRIYRCLRRAKSLQSVTLKSNSITFITLKKLLQRQPPVPQINLEGCQDIFKFSPDSDFHVWLPAIDFGRCIPEINLTPVFKTDQEHESFKSFSKTWLNCFNGRGVIEHADDGIIRFTAR